MSDEVTLRATKDIPGISARLLDGGYRTRRLKTGDEFIVPRNMAKLLVEGIKKAEYHRTPGRVAPPTQEVVEAVKKATPAKKVESKPGSARTTTRRRTARKSPAKKA
jgi:hypothetical protein